MMKSTRKSIVHLMISCFELKFEEFISLVCQTSYFDETAVSRFRCFALTRLFTH